MNKSFPAILITGIWVNASEFFRNELLFKSYWNNHYQSLGLTFPSQPINGALWGVWGFVFAGMIFMLSRRFSLMNTVIIGWVMGFVLMWIVLWNLSVLPTGLLVYAVPLSLLEVAVGAYLCKKFAPL
jgi:Na+-transporting NADH:ubiquinone oxidoreductase subunit NqrE